MKKLLHVVPVGCMAMALSVFISVAYAGGSADLSVTVTGPAAATQGDTVTYTMTVTNHSPAIGFNYVISNPIPAGLTFVSASSTCSLQSGTVVCKYNTIGRTPPPTPSPTSVQVTFRVSGTGCDPISNTATVSSTNTTDPNTANNQGTMTTTVSGQCAPSPTLSVAVKSIGSSDVAVENQRNVTLLRFEARADVADILLTKAAFSAAAGSVSNAQNYGLWADTDSDGQVDTAIQNHVSPVSGAVTFDAIIGGGYVIVNGSTTVFEVHADIASSPASNSLQLQFGTSQPDYLRAETVSNGQPLSGIRTNGTCASTCDITVTTVPSILYTLVSQGNLYVTKDTVPLNAHQLLGGTLGESVLRLAFLAEYEDIIVTDLQLTSVTGNLGSVEKLELYKEGATTPFATATVGACGSDLVPANTLCARMRSNEFVVAGGTVAKVIVRPRIFSDDNGAVSGQHLQFTIVSRAVSNNATGEGAVRAMGAESTQDLAANNGNSTGDGEVFIGSNVPSPANADITGSDNVIVLAKIASIINASSDSDGTPVPSGVAPIGQFRITAAANGNVKNGRNKVVLSDVLLNVNAVNVAISGSTLKFYNEADITTKISCSPIALDGTPLNGIVTGTFIAKCSGLAGSLVNTVISQGTDQTFALEANITDSKINNFASSELQVSLQNFSNSALTTFGASASHFLWIDQDTASTQFLWVESLEGPGAIVRSTSYQS